jgi:hypothetical protein
MGYGPLAYMEMRAYSGSLPTPSLITSGSWSATRRFPIAPNVWTQFSVGPFTTPAATTYAYVGWGAAVQGTGKIQNISNHFWVNGLSFKLDGTEKLGSNQVDSTATNSTYPCWGANNNISLSFQATDQEHAGVASFKFHPTTANNATAVTYPTTTSSAVAYIPATPGQVAVFSYWMYWDGTSYRKPRVMPKVGAF